MNEDREADHGMSLEEIEAVQERYGKGPHLAADLVVLTVPWTGSQPDLRVLLIQRGNKPYRGFFAIPGGFVDMDEDLAPAALRELQEETGVSDLQTAHVEQLGAFGHPLRDPRSRVVSVAYLAWISADNLPPPKAGDDAATASFVRFQQGIPVDENGMPLPLAFDHDRVLRMAWERVQQACCFASTPLLFLPKPFNLTQLGALYELLIGPVDARRIVQWLEELGWIQAVSPESWRVLPKESRWGSPPWEKPASPCTRVST